MMYVCGGGGGGGWKTAVARGACDSRMHVEFLICS